MEREIAQDFRSFKVSKFDISQFYPLLTFPNLDDKKYQAFVRRIKRSQLFDYKQTNGRLETEPNNTFGMSENFDRLIGRNRSS